MKRSAYDETWRLRSRWLNSDGNRQTQWCPSSNEETTMFSIECYTLAAANLEHLTLRLRSMLEPGWTLTHIRSASMTLSNGLGRNSPIPALEWALLWQLDEGGWKRTSAHNASHTFQLEAL